MQRRDKVYIFALIDALGWELVEGGFLPHILPHGQRVKTILGFSSGVIPSILTGKMPSEHGHWNLFYLSPHSSPFRWAKMLGYLPSFLVNKRPVRKAVQLISRQASGYNGYFHIYGVPVEILPFFDICEKKDIYSPGGINGAESIFDLFVKKGINYRAYSYHTCSDEGIFEAVKEDMAQERRDLYFLYLCELDAFLHKYCGNRERVQEAIDWYKARIERLYKWAERLYREVEIYVFSDHGMTQTKETFNLRGEIESLGLKMPEDYLVLYDSTMARFWFFSDRAEERIRERLEDLGCGRLLCDEELKNLGIFFQDRRYGEAIFLMKAGCLINPSFMGRIPPKGMHGFHPDEDSSYAVLFSNRKVEELGCVSSFYRLMERAALSLC